MAIHHAVLVTIPELMNAAIAAHQEGRVAQAETLYRRVLRAEPDHAHAHHLLGIMALQSGRHRDAIKQVRRAVAAAPTNAIMWNTLGAAQQGAGRLNDAAGSFGRAVELDPSYVDCWANLVLTHEARRDLSAEAAALERVTALQPANAAWWNRRGTVAYLRGQLEASCEWLQRYLALAPGDADGWSNLGAVQQRLGRSADAEASQRHALALRPDFLRAAQSLASLLVTDARHGEATVILEALAPRVPHDPQVWLDYGNALKGLERFAEALPAFDRALSLSPQLPAGLIGRGDALQGLADHHGAVACYEHAVQLTPDDPDIYPRLGAAFQALGHLDDACAAFRRCLELAPHLDRVASSLIFSLDHQEGRAQTAWDERLAWNERIGARTRSLRRPHANRRDPDRPLRIGYVSADFRRHSAAFLAMPVLSSHDHTQYQIHCYSMVRKPDELTERFRAAADVWHDVTRLSDDDLDALIRADEIDVLVDLSGHTSGNRLPVFSREPAPVQVTAWGYATGTGLETMHYFLADDVVVPPEARQWYAEEIVSLPSLICYEAPDGLPPIAPPPSLTRGQITFGAFNRMEKVTGNVRVAWTRLMAAVPDARLLVKTGGKSKQAREQLIADLVAHGVDRERIDVRGETTQAEHLATHQEIDILLDTFPHGGGVTSIEALLMGVPVITMAGERVAGRLAASFLTNLGLPDLIAETADGYVAVAAGLAADRDRLVRERETLRERVLASPIANPELYTRHLEAAYRQLWQRWCSAA